MIQTMQFTYGHLVSINSTKLLYFNFLQQNLSQNVHSEYFFFIKKTDIIHDYNNDFVFPMHNVFMIKKKTIVVVNE